MYFSAAKVFGAERAAGRELCGGPPTAPFVTSMGQGMRSSPGTSGGAVQAVLICIWLRGFLSVTAGTRCATSLVRRKGSRRSNQKAARPTPAPDAADPGTPDQQALGGIRDVARAP